MTGWKWWKELPHIRQLFVLAVSLSENSTSCLREGTFVLFVQWGLVVYSKKKSQKFCLKGARETTCVSRCHMGSWKGISGTCKFLLAGLRWEVGFCMKEQFIVCQSSVLLPSQLNFKNNRNRGGEISCALTWNAFAAFIISCSNAQDIQLISHSRLCDLHIHRNLLGCDLFLNLQNKPLQFTSNAYASFGETEYRLSGDEDLVG